MADLSQSQKSNDEYKHTFSLEKRISDKMKDKVKLLYIIPWSYLWIQTKKLNSNKEIAEENIEQESNSYLPKQVSPQFQNGQIRTNCEENEKG